jgi:hypothetical protein
MRIGITRRGSPPRVAQGFTWLLDLAQQAGAELREHGVSVPTRAPVPSDSPGDAGVPG